VVCLRIGAAETNRVGYSLITVEHVSIESGQPDVRNVGGYREVGSGDERSYEYATLEFWSSLTLWVLSSLM
jgi:hypothetical protein